ncbi:hypothetical protein K435DRAFT_776202 [Dendrothele bispora CBS 962.96]|uniref:Uncharacterized protein n=1 Tax=Dendrothele bispora (strain CBS 962.96) TaxID=1314807 RepID=A0A4S8MF28_DENBC|nr:hypothetical protein K435DRAFT_776202 [Dendrothele bispora CBS 962.96]
MNPKRTFNNCLILRSPTRSHRLLRAYHPYKRAVHSGYSSLVPPDNDQDVLRENIDGQPEAIALPLPLGQRQPRFHDHPQNQGQHQDNVNENVNLRELGPEPEDRQQRRIMSVLDLLIAVGLVLLIISSRMSDA